MKAFMLTKGQDVAAIKARDRLRNTTLTRYSGAGDKNILNPHQLIEYNMHSIMPTTNENPKAKRSLLRKACSTYNNLKTVFKYLKLDESRETILQGVQTNKQIYKMTIQRP